MKPPHSHHSPARRPSIALSPDLSTPTSESPHVKAELKLAYCNAVFQAGGLPVILPPTADKAHLDAYLERMAGVIITGGAFDVPPEMYGETARAGMGPTKPERTQFETALIKGALQRKLPILGICGGFQLINVIFGGTLVQDIATELPQARSHQQTHDRSQPQHPVEVRESTMLADAVGRGQLMVNSTHHQALAKIGTNLTVSAVASDGVVEAIESRADGQFVMGVQWHPELLTETLPAHLNIYKMLVSKARDRRH